MKRYASIIAAVLAAAAAFADQKGEDVARRYFALEKPRDARSIASMTITDKKGGRKTRKLEMLSKETAEGKRAFVRFLEPADVAGTKLLTLPGKDGSSDQRLYLPALKKARRIASSGSDGEFVNSDLYYYDMQDRDFGDFAYDLLSEGDEAPDEALAGLRFFRVEMKPKDPEAPYSRIVAWIDMSSFSLRKSECYDRKDGALLKTILFAKTQSFGGILMSTETVVSNARKKSSTVLKVSDVKINAGIPDEVFSVKNLEK